MLLKAGDASEHRKRNWERGGLLRWTMKLILRHAMCGTCDGEKNRKQVRFLRGFTTAKWRRQASRITFMRLLLFGEPLVELSNFFLLRSNDISGHSFHLR